MSDKTTKEFERGYICAVATLARAHGESVMAKYLLGCQVPDSWAHIEKYDFDALFDAGLICPHGKESPDRCIACGS